MIITEYWNWIGLEGRSLINPDGLATIQRAQRFAIESDNLDIYMSHEMHVDPEITFGKLVISRSGGYYFEHNMLLAAALTTKGGPNHPARGSVRVKFRCSPI